ncbi:MAG: HAMP domain-containing protein [Desulfatibacillum sp.]|nr:HAMP domain-containing protein [Desulfatibacillum sp.]
MRSLFMKLFLSIWLVINLSMVFMIILAVTSTSGPVSRHRKIVREHRDLLAYQAMTMYGYAAMEFQGALGNEKAQGYIDKLYQDVGVRVSVLDQNHKVLLGEAPASRVMELVRQINTEKVRTARGEKGVLNVACRTVGPSGQSLILTGMLPGPDPDTFGPHYPFPPDLWEKLAISFILCGLLCLWLTRNIAGPIRKLRAATNKVAEGDLSVRVSPGLGKRKDEIAGLAQDFDYMASRVEILLASQKRLLRDISHELRSPLARLNVALELASQHAGEKADPYLKKIGLESHRLNELIGHLHTLTMMENQPGLHFEEVDLDALLARIVEDARFESSHKGVSVSLDSPHPVIVAGIPEMLHRAVENVVRNAIIFTRDKSEVVVSLSKAPGGMAVITVQDQGTGVPESELSNLVKPFYRVQEDRARKTGGAGVGLAIADRAVALHKGRLEVENSPEGGLVVRIRLPV